MPLVYVTGVSGVGKSAVCKELKRRGYEAHDTDQEENAVWVDRKTGEVTAVAGAADRSRPGWLEDQEWRTSNDFGKSSEELEAILSWHRVGTADYLGFGAVIIDATLPLHEVVDKVLEAAV